MKRWTTICVTVGGGCLWSLGAAAFTRTGEIRNSAHRGLPRLNGIRFRGEIEKPGSELFPSEGSYVPSGLSREQYSKLKKKEADDLRKMDFGSWGPRFKRGSAPDGDWMVMPSLWTNGFNAQPEMANGQPYSSFGPLQRVAMFLRSNFPGFSMGYLLLHSIFAALALYKTPALTFTRSTMIALKGSTLNSVPLPMSSLLKIHGLRSIFGVLALPLMNRIVEVANRRHLWSRRKVVWSTILSSIGVLFFWTAALLLMRSSKA